MPNPHMLTSEYRLLRRVGRGGMGEVWEAARIIADDIVVPCAIKLLHAEFTETARERKLFLDEARIATQLDNSRIVKITGMGTSRDGRPFLVMERVDGVDLRNFIEAAKERGSWPLDVDLVTYIVGEVLVALAYAHGRIVGGDDGGIIHSDVTPGNILISSTGEVKLTDFGIARFAATAGPMSRAVGTPRYMSPEQLYGEPQRATDVYGLGVVLHELLEGERFLDGLTPDQFRARVLSGPPPELTRTGVSKWLDNLRRSMIATDPGARPQAGDALTTVIENSPRYMSAVPRLSELYAELVGARRSGVTLLKLEDSGKVAEVVPPLPIAAAGVPAPVEDAASPGEHGGADEIEPTQLLPAAESEAMTTSSPSLAKPPPLPRVAAAALVLAGVFGCLTVVLLVDVLRDPEPEPTTAEQVVVSPAPVQEAAPQISPAPPPAADPEPEPEPEPEIAAPEPEPPPSDPVEAEPESKPKPAPKPSKLPKIGVVFFVETNLEGQLKVGRKLVTVKNRSAYAELPPGKYSISWQPKGTSEWQPQGRVTIDDIAPSRYKVRLKDGQIVEAGKL